MPNAKRFRRLDQLFSQLGYGSRAAFKKHLREGRVEVVGSTRPNESDRVDPALVRFDGEVPEHPDGLLILLNKPAGYVCSHDDKEGALIYELLPERWNFRSPGLNSIGRLDKETSGLILLTDQSELVHRLTSPKHHVPKTYELEFEGALPANAVELFASGTLLLDGESKPCLPAVLNIHSRTRATIQIVEGRYHQVRRMFGMMGAPVLNLRRVQFGPLDLSGVEEGKYRILPLDTFG
jgi:16S rRNA pseudouridine516 synthase